MNSTEEELRKMFDFMREMHENYTKVLERENEVLRNTLAETQKKLDEAIETVEKQNRGGLTEEQQRMFKEAQDAFEKAKEKGGNLGGPWTIPSINNPNYPPYQYPGTGNSPIWITNPNPTYYTTSSSTGVSYVSAYSENIKKDYKDYIAAAMKDKATGKDDDN